MFNLSDATKQHLVDRPFKAGRRGSSGYYPSAASVEVQLPNTGSMVLGSCLRAEYYSKKGIPQSDPNTAYTEFIFKMGKSVEEMLIDTWKRMGIFVSSNEKFVGDVYGVPVSGELDVVIRNPLTGKLIGIEVKSCYGYMAQKEIFGTRTEPGYIKVSHLMQTFLYSYIFRPGNGERTELESFKTVYFARDSVDITEFNVVAGEYEVGDHDDWFPEVNGKVDQRISLRAIAERWKQLDKYLASDEVPPRDFMIKYTDEEIESRYLDRLISETAYTKWKKGKATTLANRPGDWNCSYCNHRSYCYTQEPQFVLPGWDTSKLKIDSMEDI